MRSIAVIATLVIAGVLGHLGVGLYGLSQLPTGSAQQISAPQEPQPPAPSQNASVQIQDWPAIFGQEVIIEPQPPSEPEPQPPAPPTPPVSSLGYTLSGTVVSDSDQWAILSHPTGQRILRVGDALEEGIVVSEITDDGVWLTTGSGREMLGFQENSPN